MATIDKLVKVGHIKSLFNDIKQRIAAVRTIADTNAGDITTLQTTIHNLRVRARSTKKK